MCLDSITGFNQSKYSLLISSKIAVNMDHVWIYITWQMKFLWKHKTQSSFRCSTGNWNGIRMAVTKQKIFTMLPETIRLKHFFLKPDNDILCLIFKFRCYVLLSLFAPSCQEKQSPSVIQMIHVYIGGSTIYDLVAADSGDSIFISCELKVLLFLTKWKNHFFDKEKKKS